MRALRFLALSAALVASSGRAQAPTADQPGTSFLLNTPHSVEALDGARDALRQLGEDDTVKVRAENALRLHNDANANLPQTQFQKFEPVKQLVPATEAAAQKLRDALKASKLDPNAVRTAAAELEAADAALATKLADEQAALDLRTQPTSIIVSGGVSLGAYQAGLLYFYTQYLLQQRIQLEDSPTARDLVMAQPQTVTGASAGAINAFLAGITGCREKEPDPTQSLFWQVWVNSIDFNALIDPAKSEATSLLSVDAFYKAVGLVQREWKSGWRDKPCHVNLGFTVTRSSPRNIALNAHGTDDNQGDVPVPLQTERVIMVINGKGGQAPGITAWRPKGDDEQRFFTPFIVEGKEGGAFDWHIAEVLRASSAFPVAWPFVELPQPAETQAKTRTKGRHRAGALFLDGGVFDNNPLGLALKLNGWSSERRDGINPAVRRPGKTAAISSRYLYVEPDATEWATPLAETRVAQRQSFLSTYFELLGSLVTTARHAEIASTLEHEPGLSTLIDVPVRQMPITGSYLLNFLAFADVDFRRFDFYMGMADAKAYLEKRETKEGSHVEVPINSPEFKCVARFRGEVVGNARPTPVSVDECRELELAKGKGDGSQATKNLFALLESSAAVREFIDRCADDPQAKGCTSTDELGVMSLELEKRQFKFTDGAWSASNVVGTVREKFHPLVKAVAAKQDSWSEEVGLNLLGKAGLDFLDYRPTRLYFGTGLNSRSGFEWELSPIAYQWLRASLGARLTHLQSRFISEGGAPPEERWTYMLEWFAHPIELDVAWPTSWLHVQLGGGFAVNGTSVGALPRVWRFPIEGSIGVTVLQRLYFRVNGSYFLFDRCAFGPCANVPIELAASRQALAGTYGEWSFSLGWRLIE